MSGDENAKTTLGARNADAMAYARRQGEHVPSDSTDDGAADSGTDEPDDNYGSPIGVGSAEAFELSGSDSPPFQLNQDSEGFAATADSGPPVEGDKNPSRFKRESPELSVLRRLEADSVLGASSLDSLDWDLGDDYDAPSGLDQVLEAPSSPPVEPPVSKGGDSLPSTSALFGADYRGDPSEDFNASAQLIAGDSTSQADYEPQEVEPRELGDEQQASEAEESTDSDDAMPEVPDVELPAVDGDGIAEGVDIPTADVGEPDVGSASSDDEAELELDADEQAREEGDAVDGGPRVEPDQFDLVAMTKRGLNSDPSQQITPFAVRSTRLSLDADEPSPAGQPRPDDTPQVSQRYTADTPIIASPVAAARKLTPALGSPYRSRPPKKERSAAFMIRAGLAAFAILGLIASALTYFL